jgi:hypothetical protein
VRSAQESRGSANENATSGPLAERFLERAALPDSRMNSAKHGVMPAVARFRLRCAADDRRAPWSWPDWLSGHSSHGNKQSFLLLKRTVQR